MDNNEVKTPKILRGKYLFGCLLALFGFGVAVIWVRGCDSRAHARAKALSSLEFKLAKEYISQSRAIKNEFGDISQITVDNFRYYVATKIPEITTEEFQSTGSFSFKIKGTKDTGKVWISWRYSDPSQNFTVLRLTRSDSLGSSRELDRE